VRTGYRVALSLAAVAAVAGCAATPGRPAPTAAATTPAPPGPVLRACADAGAVIRHSTGEATTALAAAVSAGERGDAAAQRAAMARLRAAYAAWSAGLRIRAGLAPDPRLEAALTEYAGAVDAAIARVGSAADLETLHTFTERELDLAANHFAAVCPR
jgi:hypothetical protein